MRFWLRWLGPVLLAAACWVGEARPQNPPGDTGQPAEGQPKSVFPAFVAVVSAMIVLVIVCMPSRKGN